MAKYGKVVDFVHLLIKSSYQDSNDNNFIDATCGNGFDTLFLCKLAGSSGRVMAFDIQEQAIERTKTLLETNLSYKNYEIIKESHDKIDQYLTLKIDAAIFNLGYLPYSDKKVTTKPDTTVNAIKKLLPSLKDDGRIFITSYISQDTGQEIKEINDFLQKLDKVNFNVIHMKIINKENNPPELFIIEKN